MSFNLLLTLPYMEGGEHAIFRTKIFDLSCKRDLKTRPYTVVGHTALKWFMFLSKKPLTHFFFSLTLMSLIY